MAQSKWIAVHDVKNRALVESLRIDLDAGEADAIACAVEVNADVLLVDERLGRQVAGRLGLRVIGLLGVLLQAKRVG